MSRRKGGMQKFLVPSLVIVLLLGVAIAVLPLFFGSMDNAATASNISTSQYATAYETGTTINLYLIYGLTALMFAFIILLVVAVIDHFRG